MFGSSEVLIAAKNLLDFPGVEIAEDVTEVTYLHIMFDRHEIVRANGVWSESLYLGEQARLGMTDEQLQEIEAIFPGLLEQQLPQEPARMLAQGPRTRKLVQRSVKNRQALFEAIV